MMGAGGKRKMCGTPGGAEGPGGKAARWEESSLARLQAVAVPGEPWPAWGAAWGPEERPDCGCRGPRAAPPYQETIRCAENGKSYLELGSGGWPRRRCCARQCYRERRLKIMNLCVYKLSRFRQSADPSLRRSVLVCNTLRRMEREAERDAAEEATREGRQPAPPPREPAHAHPPPPAGRLTPFPAPDTDSGYGEEECARPIDWGSVLSLSSQSALDPLNNNEPCGGGGWELEGVGGSPARPLDVDLSLAGSWAGSWAGPEERAEGELDSFMHILVGSS